MSAGQIQLWECQFITSAMLHKVEDQRNYDLLSNIEQVETEPSLTLFK